MIHALGFARHTAAVTVDPGLIIGFMPLWEKAQQQCANLNPGQQLAGGLEKQFARLIGNSVFLQFNFLYFCFCFFVVIRTMFS